MKTQLQLVGNAVVGQSGGPTAAINATLAGLIRGVNEWRATGSGRPRQIGKLYGMCNGIEGFLNERLIDLGEDMADGDRVDLLAQTPAAYLGSCRKKLPRPEDAPAFYEKVLSLFKKYDIRYFFYIGGNDSMDTVARLSGYARQVGYDMLVIGIPKTIDNDLVCTDHTPGFGSAAKFIATVTQELIRDCAVYTVPAVTIVEIMGRDAGWLTAASAIGRVVNGCAPDLVYLPEAAFSMDAFFSDIRAALARHPNVVVAVSEGIRFADGRYVCEHTSPGTADVFGHTQLAGTGRALELAVRQEFGCKVRSVELNLPQRCAAHIASATDISESLAIGAAAAKAAADGLTKEMMIFERTSSDPYVCEIRHADVDGIANKIRHVPDEFIVSEGNQVTDGCCRYLLPLILGEPEIRYEMGLPVHVRREERK